MHGGGFVEDLGAKKGPKVLADPMLLTLSLTLTRTLTLTLTPNLQPGLPLPSPLTCSHASNCSLSALSTSSPSRRASSRLPPSRRIARSSRRATALKSLGGYSELPQPKTAYAVPARRVFSTRKSRDIWRGLGLAERGYSS